MDDPTRRCENDTGICDAPSGAPGPKRGPHFFELANAPAVELVHLMCKSKRRASGVSEILAEHMRLT